MKTTNHKWVHPGELIAVLAILLILFVFALSGCTQLPTQQLNVNTIYKRDMVITVNGVTEEGVVVVPMKNENSIHVVARGNLDMFAMVNCTGEQTKEKAWNVKETVPGGIFGWGKKTIEKPREVEFTYRPSGLETMGACPMNLHGFAKEGQHSWGFVDFKTTTFKLQGEMVCNGVTKRFDGVGACQSRETLYQVLRFEDEVFMSPDPGCELGQNQGKEFIFRMPRGICTYRIKSRKTQDLGKLTLIGYTSILIREN